MLSHMVVCRYVTVSALLSVSIHSNCHLVLILTNTSVIFHDEKGQFKALNKKENRIKSSHIHSVADWSLLASPMHFVSKPLYSQELQGECHPQHWLCVMKALENLPPGIISEMVLTGLTH